jgi:hypothetical protein
MSYKLRVLNDSPLGFWQLNSLNGSLYSDLTYHNNTSSQNTSSVILTNDVLPLTTNSNYDGYVAGAKFLSTSQVDITNSNNTYKMFYQGTENLTFSIELWLSFNDNPPVNNSILTVKSPAGTAAKIYVNNDKIYFTVYDSNNTAYTVSKQVTTWDSQNHILATYSKGNLNILVNSLADNSLTLQDNFLFLTPTSNYANMTYSIGPAAASGLFVINDLAFYDYVLSDNLIKSHMVWGTNDSAPQTYVKQTSGYFFDIKDRESMFSYKKDFKNVANYKQGFINNLITDKDGLTLKSIPSLTKVGSSGTISYSTALAVTGDNSAKFNNFSNYFTPNKFSILGQINWVPNYGANPSVIWAIEGINNDEWIYLAQSSDKKLTLYYHTLSTTYPYSYSEKILAQIPTAVTSNGAYNIGLSVNSNNINLYMSNVGSVSNTSYPSYNYKNLNLYFGNEYSSAPTLPLSGSIDNISILSYYQDPSAYTLYGQSDSFSISFNNTLAISQKGTWRYAIPSSYLNKTKGTRVTWDSGSSDNSVLSTSQNVIAEVSNDSGSTWTQLTNAYPAFQFPDSSSSQTSDLLVRFTLYTSDSSSAYQPRVDNIFIGCYKNLDIFSEGGGFVLTPRAGSYIGDTYAIKKNFFNILARSKNFGIKINKTSNKNSIATIAPVVAGNGFQTVEFWFRYDALSSSSVQTILDTLGMNAKLYFDSNGNCLFNGFSSVYVNGIQLSSSNIRLLTKGESYHFICVYPTSIFSTLYMGGDKSLNNFSYGTYGYISLYPNALSQTDAQNRYLSFLSSSVSTVNANASLTQASNLVGFLQEYQGISSITSTNQAILAYNRATNVTL